MKRAKILKGHYYLTPSEEIVRINNVNRQNDMVFYTRYTSDGTVSESIDVYDAEVLFKPLYRFSEVCRMCSRSKSGLRLLERQGRISAPKIRYKVGHRHASQMPRLYTREEVSDILSYFEDKIRSIKTPGYEVRDKFNYKTAKEMMDRKLKGDS